MKKIHVILVFLTISCSNNPKLCSKKEAINLAEKEWIKLFGVGVNEKKPFVASLKNDSIWVVQGTLPDDYLGGVPYAEINAKNCKILEISHGK